MLCTSTGNKMVAIKCGKFNLDLSLITVEPVLFLYMIGSQLNYPTFQAFVFDKVCYKKYNETFCGNLRNKTFQEIYKEEEDYVQTETSHWILKKNIAELAPSFLVTLLFLGSWGDKVGRKLPVILPVSGAVLSTVCYLLMAIIPSSKIEYIFIPAVLNGLTGSFTGMLMAAFSYITHAASSNNRTIRVGILESMSFFAGTVSIFVSGIMLDNTSFVFVFSFIIGSYSLALIYSVVRLENLRSDMRRGEDESVCEYWFLSSLRETGRCVGRSREGRNKLYIGLLIIVFIIIVLGTASEIDILLLYTRRAPLNWSQTTFGYYKGLENFTRSLLLVTLLPLCKKRFHLRDTTLAVIGLLSKAIGLVVISIAAQTWLMFTVVVLAMFQGIPGAVTRSLSSSLVKQDEQGRLFGLIGSTESLVSMLASLLFNELYPASLSFFPGFSFVLAAGLCILGAGIMVWLRWDLPESIAYENVTSREPDVSHTETTKYNSTEDVRM